MKWRLSNHLGSPPPLPSHLPTEERQAIGQEYFRRSRRSFKWWLGYSVILTSFVTAMYAANRTAPHQSGGTGSATLWGLVALAGFAAGFLAIIVLVNSVERKHRKAVWRARRICTECGYDLRTNLERCPECGALVAAGPD